MLIALDGSILHMPAMLPYFAVLPLSDVLLQKKVDVVFNHFNPWLPKGAVNEVKKYITVNSIESWTTMLGHTFGLL